MKNRSFFSSLMAAAVGAMLGLGAVGCLVSAYDFSVSLWAVGFFCLLAAGLRSLPKGRYIAGFGFALVTVWLLWNGTLIRGAEALLFRLTTIYRMGYGWKVIRWSDLPVEELNRALPVILFLLGSPISLFAAAAVKGKNGIPAIFLTLLTMGACFVVTDKVPDTGWVFLVFFVGALLLLSGLLRKQNQKEAQRLLLTMAIPVFLSVLLLFAFVPKNGYTGAARADRWKEAIVSLWDRITGNVADLSGTGAVDLRDVGRQSFFESEVMQVISPVDGKLYLRGRSLDTYDGKSWQNSGTELKLPWPEESNLERIGEVEITTQYVHRLLYLPYYSQSLDMNQYVTGKINEHKLKKYSVTCARLTEEALAEINRDADPYTNMHTIAVDLSSFTGLPDSTRRWARQKVEEITGGKQNWYYIAKDIEAYVENSATYDLKTNRMPLGQNDFARWFLEKSDTGYCVHFATTAAVLLRAAGIPARYVTGYMVNAKSKEAVVVTDADAHAWVEYWLPTFGWVVLEATPAAGTPSMEGVEIRPIPTAPTQTETERDETTSPEETPWEAPSILFWLLGAAGVIALALLQRKLRLAYRTRRLEQGTANEMALARWRYLAACHNALKTAPDTAYLDLAEKAKFSQYTITEEELAVLDMALEDARKQLKKRNVFLRLYCAMILAIC